MHYPLADMWRRKVEGWRERVRKPEFVPELISALSLVALGLGLFFYLHLALGVPRRIIGLGAVCFALGAAGFKGILYQGLLVMVLHPRLKPLPLAVVQGLISGISELGAALLFYLYVLPPLSTLDLIGFGAGAGIIEALVIGLMTLQGKDLLKGTPIETPGNEWEAYGATPVSVLVSPVYERIIAMGLQIGTRGLVYIALTQGLVLPGLVALFCFAGVDGVAYYGHLKHWKFLHPRVALPFYGWLTLLALVACGGLAVWS